MKQKLIYIVGIILVAAIVIYSPFERKNSEIGDILNDWGEHQQEMSDKFTDQVVSGAEGSWVGEHQVDGSNWSIPNILRHILGVDR